MSHRTDDNFCKVTRCLGDGPICTDCLSLVPCELRQKLKAAKAGPLRFAMIREAIRKAEEARSTRPLAPALHSKGGPVQRKAVDHADMVSVRASGRAVGTRKAVRG